MTCAECAQGSGLGFDITMALLPIVDIQRQEVFAYEVLVRGKQGQSAGHVSRQINNSNRYPFDYPFDQLLVLSFGERSLRALGRLLGRASTEFEILKAQSIDAARQ